MRSIVVLSFFVHLLLAGALGGIVGTGDDEGKKKNYISAELIPNSVERARSPRAKGKPAARIAANAERVEKATRMPEAGMSMVPDIPPSALPDAGAKTSGARTGPEDAQADGGDAVYLTVHGISRRPVFRTQVKPGYPPSERNAGRESRVVVEVYLGRDGAVDEVKIIKSGGASFDEAVIRALRASSFEPGYKDGKEVAVRMQIPYVFTLR